MTTLSVEVRLLVDAAANTAVKLVMMETMEADACAHHSHFQAYLLAIPVRCTRNDRLNTCF